MPGSFEIEFFQECSASKTERPYKESSTSQSIGQKLTIFENESNRIVAAMQITVIYPKVHAYIISSLKKDMPSVFGKEKKQKELIKGLDAL